MLLVGRDLDLRTIGALVDTARSTGGMILVEGPPGVGKTALRQQAAELAAGTCCRVLRARAIELERQFTFGLARRLFERSLTSADDTVRERWLSGSAGTALAAVGRHGVRDDAVGDITVLDGLYWLTSNLCEERPLTLIVDDLHWGDVGSLRLLAYLCSIRPNGPGTEQHLIDLLATDTASQQMRPGELSFSVEKIVRERFAETVDRPFIAACHTATSGNPVPLSELLALVEQVASHLLLVPLTGVDWHVKALKTAASAAAGRGAPEVAAFCLERCLQEAMPGSERLTVLLEAASASSGVHIQTDSCQYATVTRVLCYLHLRVENHAEGEATLVRAFSQLPAAATELAGGLRATRIMFSLFDSGREAVSRQIAELDSLAMRDSPSSKDIAGMLSIVSCYRADPAVRRLAKHAISGDDLLRYPSAMGLACAWHTLVTSEDPEAESAINAGLAHGHRRGATRQLVLGHDDPWTAEVLLERGKSADAESVLARLDIPDPVPESGPWYFALFALARLRYEQGRLREALPAALAAGARFTGIGGENPAEIPWRSEAATILHALGRDEEARDVVAVEVKFARQWVAPGALGRALRVSGLVSDHRTAGLDLLKESVVVLEESTARLEYAKSLVAPGSAQRRLGQNTDAKRHLSMRLDIAAHANAVPHSPQRRFRTADTGRTSFNSPITCSLPSFLILQE